LSSGGSIKDLKNRHGSEIEAVERQLGGNLWMKVSSIAFCIATAALIGLIIYIRINGSTPDSIDLAGDNGKVAGGSGGLWLALKGQGWWKKGKLPRTFEGDLQGGGD
jgi:hypothetical protein